MTLSQCNKITTVEEVIAIITIALAIIIVIAVGAVDLKSKKSDQIKFKLILIFLSNNTGGSGGNGHNEENNKEEEKMQDALSSAIVREKPNVKWTDVAGLDQAKASL